VLNLWHLTQSFHHDANGKAFFFQCRFPLHGNVVSGMVASDEEQE
jgi:hypothetical protein